MQHKSSQNNLTFLKSNYKYKRREMWTMRALPVCGIFESRKRNQLAATWSEPNTSATATASASATTPTAATSGRKCSTILSLFIVITWKLLQAMANCLSYAGRIIANASDDTSVNVNVNANASTGHDHDVNAATGRHPYPYTHVTHDDNHDNNDDNGANDKVSKGREHHQQHQQHPQQQHHLQQQHLSTSSLQKSKSCTTITSTTIILPAAKSGLPLMTLLIALLFGMRLVDAGTCWGAHLGNGKCNQIFSTNITKSKCCGASQTFSYTDRDLSNVEYFFATAIGGGVECAPCIESCKSFKCGPNKKCVKRKGRPKCVCAPECGATLRQKQQQHHSAIEQQWQKQHILAKSSLSPSSSAMSIPIIPPRGSRSLSSEITNTNLGLVGAKWQHKQSDNHRKSNNGTDNQRKEAQQQQQQQQQKQQQQRQETPMPMPKRQSHKGAQGETKHKRLLIIDTSKSNLQKQPTTRRLQMKGNNSGNTNAKGKGKSNSNGGRVQMQMKVETERLMPVAGCERHRHRKSKNNSNNNGKHLTRSMTTLTATMTATGANDSSTTPAQTAQSRHKLANANEPANDINRQLLLQPQPQPQSLLSPSPSPSQQEDNAPARIRHQHEQNAPNHKQQYNESHQRRRKHKHSHKDHQHKAATLLTANTTMSGFGSGGRRRLLLAEHGSETAASSSSSRVHLANTDDLAFLAGIYEPTKQPVQQLELQQQQQHTNPVCGTDGRTYNTECQLLKRACRTNNAQLEVAYRGHCKTSCNGVQCLNGLTCVEDQYMMPHCITCQIECPREDGALDLDGDGQPDELFIDEERAVCGVDGKTYRSTCDINRMICRIGRSIAVAYPGPCRADRVTCADIKCGPKDTCLVDLQTHMPRCVSCRYKCPRKQHRTPFRTDKICGYNNHTYNSWCEMRKDSCATGFFIGVRLTAAC